MSTRSAPGRRPVELIALVRDHILRSFATVSQYPDGVPVWAYGDIDLDESLQGRWEDLEPEALTSYPNTRVGLLFYAKPQAFKYYLPVIIQGVLNLPKDSDLPYVFLDLLTPRVEDKSHNAVIRPEEREYISRHNTDLESLSELITADQRNALLCALELFKQADLSDLFPSEIHGDIDRAIRFWRGVWGNVRIEVLQARAVLAEKIRSTFANRAYPGDDHIGRQEIRAFRGDWQKLAITTLRKYGGETMFFSAEGWAYYFPAFAIYVLNDPVGAETLMETLIYRLLPPNAFPSPLPVQSFSKLLNEEEKSVILELLENYRALFPGDNLDHFPQLDAAIVYWRTIATRSQTQE